MAGPRRLRILFVARPISVHSARWINQVADEGWDIHLFPAFEAPLHADFRNLTTYGVMRRATSAGANVAQRTLWPFAPGGDRLRLLASRLPEKWGARAAWLARVVARVRPDLVHSLEFQQAGYLTLEALKFYEGRFPPWAVTNWGSDITLYGPLAAHRERVRALLERCDYYTCECRRDVALAREYGFRGEALPVLPVAGGFHVERMREYREPGPTSARRVLSLKGYQHWAGRALVGLQAVELCAAELRAGGYTVALYSASEDVRIAAEHMAARSGVRLEFVPDGTHEEMLRLHGRSRVSVGLSISEGLSTSALEALVMGAFPVQSDTSCLTEMVRDGESLLMVPAEDPERVAEAIRRALTDDELVDRAAETNARVASERLDYEGIRRQVVEMYQRIAAQGHARRE